MYDTEENKDICMYDNLFNCRQYHQHVHLKEKKHVLIIKKWKETYTYWKFIDKISYFKRQINIIVVLLSFAVEVSTTSNQCERIEY